MSMYGIFMRETSFRFDYVMNAYYVSSSIYSAEIENIITHHVLNKLWSWDADLFDSPEDVHLLVNLQLFYGIYTGKK